MLMKEPALPPHRDYCYACRRARVNCLCASIRPFATRLRFVILMHEEEAKKQKTGTGRLARLCLENSELLVGVDFSADARVNELLRDPAYAPFVLYPGPKAVNFKTLDPAALSPGKKPLIFVIDGTWRTARSVLNRSRNVGALPRLSFSGNYVSQFAIKHQPRAHCVSTIEAIYYLCGEAEAAGLENAGSAREGLMKVFRELVDKQLGYARQHRRRREDNKRTA